MKALLAPGERASLPSLLQCRADVSPDAPFVTFLGETVTYAQMLVRSHAAADALAAVGLRRGDRLALMLPNCLEFLDLWFASALLGAVLVPINTALQGDGLRYLIEHCGAKLLVADAPLAQTVAAAQPDRRQRIGSRVRAHEHLRVGDGLTDERHERCVR